MVEPNSEVIDTDYEQPVSDCCTNSANNSNSSVPIASVNRDSESIECSSNSDGMTCDNLNVRVCTSVLFLFAAAKL